MKNYPLQGIDEFKPFETYKTSEGGVYKNKDQALLSFLWYTGDAGMYGTMEAYGLLEFVRDELFELKTMFAVPFTLIPKTRLSVNSRICRIPMGCYTFSRFPKCI